MGGNYKAVGNIRPSAEFNFFYDPEASYILLQSIKKPIHLTTWEATKSSTVTWVYNFLSAVTFVSSVRTTYIKFSY